MCAQIIFLHGPSSSGKSTLARALQAQVDRPFWHVSIDHLRDSGMIPIHRFRAGDFDWMQSRERVFEGFHTSLSAYADAGNNLIVEHILDQSEWVGRLVALLADHDVFFVGMHCDLETLNRREQQRADRPVGSAQRDFDTVHDGRVYDLELNGADPVDTNVSKLLHVWRSGRRKSEFRAAQLM